MSIRAHVVGIDVSRASLEREEFLKQKHNLSNLTLHQMRIEDVATLAEDFDFIDCHGVLHHLVDPVAGLRALGQVLRTDGVIAVMVYGKYGRIGVDVLQELFRVMGLEQDPAGVRVIKDTLAALPPNHPVQAHRRGAPKDMASDEGLVDTFLHRRDRTYSSGDCLDLVEAAGLAFQGWKENGYYHPNTRLASNHALWAHLSKLNERDLWQTVEMLDATIGAHFFHVCRPDRNPSSYVIEFADDAFLDYVPIARITQMAQPDIAQNKPRSFPDRRCRRLLWARGRLNSFDMQTASAPCANAWRKHGFRIPRRPPPWRVTSSALSGASAMFFSISSS